MTDLVVADIGGTHARFALATVERGRVFHVEPPETLRTREHSGLEAAWTAFARGRRLPPRAAFAIAAPVDTTEIHLTNAAWVLRPAELKGALGLEQLTLVNDFGAVGHAVAVAGDETFRHLAGPPASSTGDKVVAVVGPGTGLGVAQVIRRGSTSIVVETEGGHVGFAPEDEVDQAILTTLRAQHGRVSAERVASGRALPPIAAVLAELDGLPAPILDETALWAAALDGSDPLAVRALDRFCRALGSVAGDIALAQGATEVVIAGGLGLRLADHLPGSAFARHFTAKGRFAERMERLPVRILTMEQPGLFGAAAAFAAAHG